MSSSISLKVASITATVTVGVNITDQQVGAALARYARSLAIPITGDSQADLTAILNSIVSDIKARAKAVDLSDQQAAAKASQLATAEANNAL